MRMVSIVLYVSILGSQLLDVWKELVCVAFLEEVCHGWRTFRFQMTPAIVIGTSTYCFQFKR